MKTPAKEETHVSDDIATSQILTWYKPGCCTGAAQTSSSPIYHEVLVHWSRYVHDTVGAGREK